MVVMFASRPNEIWFMEAVGRDGVRLNNWETAKSCIGEYFTKIAFRHLEWERTEESLNIVNQFLLETLGNQYSFRLNQLKKQNTKKY